ncbi:hypothetical protein ACFL47_00295 [Candidatus Latescibacterota bacterium]
MKKPFGALLVILLISLFTGCLESSTDSVVDGDVVDDDDIKTDDVQVASLMTASADSAVIEMFKSGTAGEFEDPDDMFPYLKEIALLYMDAAEKDPTNSRANFGAALFSFQGMLDDPLVLEVENLIESLDTEFPDVTAKYVNHYFMSGIAKTTDDIDIFGDPFESINTLMISIQNALSNPNMIAYIQNMIDNVLVDQIDESIGYMDKVITDKEFVYHITPEMTGEIETYELDLGEVYMFAAMMRAMRANLKIMNAYDLSIGLPQDYYPETLLNMIIAQDTNNGSFLTLRNNTTLPSAKQDLINALTMIENAVVFIESETDSQENDLIKQGDILEADGDIMYDINEEDNPIPVLRNITGITDLSGRIKTMLDGPFDVEIDEGVTISFDISAFLDNGIPDIKALLPYHTWNMNNLDEPFSLVDAEGNLTDGPIFPDVTFGGLLPGMTWEMFVTLTDDIE